MQLLYITDGKENAFQAPTSKRLDWKKWKKWPILLLSAPRGKPQPYFVEFSCIFQAPRKPPNGLNRDMTSLPLVVFQRDKKSFLIFCQNSHVHTPPARSTTLCTFVTCSFFLPSRNHKSKKLMSPTSNSSKNRHYSCTPSQHLENCNTQNETPKIDRINQELGPRT